MSYDRPNIAKIKNVYNPLWYCLVRYLPLKKYKSYRENDFSLEYLEFLQLLKNAKDSYI